MLTFLLALTAAANPFVVERDGLRADITDVAVPEAPERYGAHPRVCRVLFSWDGEGVSVEPTRCAEASKSRVLAAAETWSFEVSGEGSGELLEAWFVDAMREEHDPKIFVRQDHRIAFTLPDGVDPLLADPRGLVFPEFPDELPADTVDAQCNVDIEVGKTGLVNKLEVSDCDETFHATTDEALRRLSFKVPLLDGSPLATALSIGVDFERSFDEPPGRSFLRLPSDPDMGARKIVRTDEPADIPEPPPYPDWEPLFSVRHKAYAEVGVYQIVKPAPVLGLDAERRCTVLFGVNSQRLNTAWADPACHEDVAEQTLAAARKWNLMHGEVRAGEMYGRFRATFVYAADGGEVRIVLPGEDLVSTRDNMPEFVTTISTVEPLLRVPPRLPAKMLKSGLQEAECTFDVAVDARGRTEVLGVDSCPAEYVAAGERAVKRWRWTRPEVGGEYVTVQTRVRLRFSP